MNRLFRAWSTVSGLYGRLPPQLVRLLGVLAMVLALQGVILFTFYRNNHWKLHDTFVQSVRNEQTVAAELGLYGLPTLGVGVLMISGGIDLSIGAVVCLGAVCYALMLGGPITLWETRIIALLGSLDLAAAWYFLAPRLGVKARWLAGLIALGVAVVAAFGLDLVGQAALLGRRNSPEFGALVVVWAAMHIGVAHGLLVTKLRLQPFLVTLCGLFMYRGVAQWLAPAGSPGWNVPANPDDLKAAIQSFHDLYVGAVYGVPNELWLMLGVAVVLGLFLHGTRHGRYLFAIGANEEAARYAGVPTDNYKILAYAICSTLAGAASVGFLLYNDAAQPSTAGSYWELYAITGAVLGGCSLRGGEGSAPGLVLGAAVLPLLRKVYFALKIPSELEFLVIGAALLLGTTVDELLKRRGPRRV